jgi:hypothetical protein
VHETKKKKKRKNQSFCTKHKALTNTIYVQQKVIQKLYTIKCISTECFLVNLYITLQILNNKKMEEKNKR